MTETHAPTETGDPSKAHGGRLTQCLHRWKWKQRKDFGVLGIGVVLSGVLTVVGVAHVGWLWILALGCAITAVASLATNALQQRKLRDRSRSLWQALVVAIALLMGIFCYHEWGIQLIQ